MLNIPKHGMGRKRFVVGTESKRLTLRQFLATIPLIILAQMSISGIANWITASVAPNVHLAFGPLVTFLIYAALYLTMYAAMYILMPSPPETATGAKDPNVISQPTAEEDRVIPEYFGTVLTRPNLIWAGQATSKELEAKD